MKILILSTVHRWNDPRLFHKQACTLAREHEVTLAAVDDGPPRAVQGVQLHPLGIWNDRWDRPRLWWRAYLEILRSKAEVVHFHDPELALLLLPAALLGGKRLFCDIHEHPAAAIAGRSWIPRIFRKPIAALFSAILRLSPYLYDQVLLAEESYAPLLPQRPNVHLIRNYALIPPSDFAFLDRYQNFDPQQNLRLLYVGSITENRGARRMVETFHILKARFPGLRLDLVGKIRPPSLEKWLQECAQTSGGRMVLHGYTDLSELDVLLRQAHLGLVPLQPHPNFAGSLSTKFFDYMVYGLPCVASDFPLWQRFFAENPAGLTVNMTNPKELAQTIADLANSPSRLQEFSRNAYDLVRQKFNWEREGVKLLQIYNQIIC